MSLDEAVDLVLFAFEHGEAGDILVQKAPACTIQTQAEAVCELFGGKKEDIKVIGIYGNGANSNKITVTSEAASFDSDAGTGNCKLADDTLTLPAIGETGTYPVSYLIMYTREA